MNRMKDYRKFFLGLFCLVFVFLLISPTAVLSAKDDKNPKDKTKEKKTKKTASRHIILNLAARTIYLYEGKKLLITFPVAIGMPGMATPAGDYYIANKSTDPTWYPPDSPWARGSKPIPPGPGNPLGSRWMGLDRNSIGLHGTNQPYSIGYAVSHGCVRMHTSDAVKLYDMVKVGTPVKIMYQSIEVIFHKSTGEVYLVVHSDVYYRGTNTISNVRRELADLKVDVKISDETITKALRQRNGRPLLITPYLASTFNGKRIELEAFVPPRADSDKVVENLHVSHEKLQKYMQINITWDKKEKQAYLGKKKINGYFSETEKDKLLINLSDVAKAMGFDVDWDAKTKSIDIYTKKIYLNNQLLRKEALIDDNKLYLSKEVIKQQLPLAIKEDKSQKLIVINRAVIKSYREMNTTYLPVKDISSLLGFSVFSYNKNKAIVIKSPSVFINGSKITGKNLAFIWKKDIYFKFDELQKTLHIPLNYNAKENIVKIREKEFKDIIKEKETVYFALEKLNKIAYVGVNYSKKDNAYYIKTMTASLNNIFIPLEFLSQPGEVSVSIVPLLSYLNIKEKYDFDKENQQLSLNGAKVKAVVHKDTIFVPVRHLRDLLGVHIRWNKQFHKINILYDEKEKVSSKPNPLGFLWLFLCKK